MKLSITEFNRNVSRHLGQSQHEDVVITNHGKDVAIIISPEKYASLQKFERQRNDTETLADALSRLGGVDFEWELPEREPWPERDTSSEDIS